MNSEEQFLGYLRREVDKTGKRFDMAQAKIYALTRGPEVRPEPALLAATESLAEAMQKYVAALRRLTHYAARQAELQQGQMKRAAAYP